METKNMKTEHPSIPNSTQHKYSTHNSQVHVMITLRMDTSLKKQSVYYQGSIICKFVIVRPGSTPK